MSQRNDVSALSAEFDELIRCWLADREEILVMVRFSHAAGNREYRLFRSIEDLRDWIATLPSRTSVIAFRNGSLSLRGAIDETLIARCLRELPEGSEYLVVHFEPWTAGRRTWFHYDSGTSHRELAADLRENPGAEVAVGLHPDWLDDSEDVFEAIVPWQDGRIERGVY